MTNTLPVEAFLKLETKSGILIPFTEQEADKTRKLPSDQPIRGQLYIARNIGNHKRVWAFFNALFGMQDQFESLEVFRKWLIMKAGFVDIMVIPEQRIGPYNFPGGEVILPKSIAFHNMDEEEFRRCFSAMITVFLNSICNPTGGIRVRDINAAWNQAMEFA